MILHKATAGNKKFLPVKLLDYQLQPKLSL